ncbi:helix-turn-helix transcriptional regulator [Tissierella creatinophila]|uniref:Transcriptional repressor CcpN n=1 Tax=Tissierella creatinophila DSM 6911 TaxID=1123403 RepID=A0A1U7M7V7_TISCR|nr:helix-turn-helix transcriptional regulator [Tissierella creatinophila]OLS03365.1 transcriptional repressor CcpN [Tissierella creatinophila DSM 6911]
MSLIQFSKRQEKIIDIVKKNEPITSEDIGSKLNLSRGTLRTDLALLTMIEVLDAKPRVGYFYVGRTNFNDIYTKLENILVQEIYSVPIVLADTTLVYDVVVTMFVEDVGSIFLSNDGELSGVVSRKDIIKFLMGGKDLYTVPISIIMTRMPHIVYTTPDKSALSAAKKLIDNEIDSIPVVEIKKEKALHVIGRITKTNITRLFVELGEDL